MKFKKGDVIISDIVEREIVKAYKHYYTWKYLDIETVFDSRNSNDPLFEWWKLKETV